MGFDVRTYSAAVEDLDLDANPTDVLTLTGPAKAIVKVQRIRITGIATLAGTAILNVVKRSDVDTDGTSTQLEAVSHDSNDGAALAVCNAYTANPTLGTAIGNVRSQRLALLLVGVGVEPVSFEFGDLEGKPIFLRTEQEQLAVNLNGVAPTGARLSMYIEWTEE